MARRSYSTVMDKALKPYGFTRDRLKWTRVRGDVIEMIDIQPSRYSGRTANVSIKNLETEKIYAEILEPLGDTYMFWISSRLGHLIDNCDRWWEDQPDGPEDMAALTVQYALPWFDEFSSLEQQATQWYGRGIENSRGYYAPGLIGLALTLYRMGEIDEALSVLAKPVPKLAIRSWVAKVVRVRDWLLAQRDCGAKTTNIQA